MQNVAVTNPRAAAGRVEKWWQRHGAQVEKLLGSVEVRQTSAAGDATRITREALNAGVERVIAVGGDGTINEVVNGFFEGGRAINCDATLIVFPAGTGGDFARSIGLAKRDMREALEVASERLIDVGRATMTNERGKAIARYFINISSFGSSGLIVDKVNRASKSLGGKASFFLGTVRGLVEYDNQPIRLVVDGRAEEMVVNTVAVANGRYFGGSMKIAPDARVDDGLFDIVVLGELGLPTFLRYSRRIYAGTHLDLPGVRQLRGRVVRAEPLGGDDILIDLDGEQPGKLPVTYEIMPEAVKVLAPWKDAEAIA